MRVVFRTDSSAQIGTGHVMRCLALANALRSKGAECSFICRDLVGNISGLIEKYGYKVSLLAGSPKILDGVNPLKKNIAHYHWLGCCWTVDARETIACLDGAPDWLVVDHYGIDLDWESALRPHCKKVMVIDDLADRSHNCDLILDQGLISDDGRYQNLIAADSRTLFGPKYALLREEFECVTDVRADARFSNLPRLLVMFGGADLRRQTEHVLRALAAMDWKGIVDVIAGPLYPDLQSLRSLARGMKNVQLHVSPNDIPVLMRRAGLSIGASGVTSLERCACGLPSLTISQASNQRGLAERLAEIGAHWYLGPENKLKSNDWSDALTVITRYPAILRSMSRIAESVCDGKGASRVASYILKGQMVVRRATAHDVNLLYAWRNDDRTRAMSQNPEALDCASHHSWFFQMLERTDVDLLICGNNGQDMACVRFDCVGEVATVSIYVDPERQGKGVGSAALNSSIDWLCKSRPYLRKVHASIMPHNYRSHRMFINYGFRKIEEKYSIDLQS